MSNRLVLIAFTLAVFGALVACGAEQDGPAAPRAENTKAQMIQDLRSMLADMASTSHDKLVARFALPEGMTVEQAKEKLPGAMKRELSEAGIAVLEAKGTFGALLEQFPERGANWATRLGLKPDECFALKHDGAEVAARWTGSAFSYIRVDDVAKLK